MSAIATARPHLKTAGFAGGRSLTRCEDPGCKVAPGGRADCGRIACPRCGFSGSNLSRPDVLEGLVRCSCRHVFDVERSA